MASYHFSYKRDNKPQGKNGKGETKVKGIEHIEYINREGKYECTNQKESCTNNISTVHQKNFFQGQHAVLYKSNYGIIENTQSGISVSPNASNQTINIALLLANEAGANSKLVLNGTKKFINDVISTAAYINLDVNFANEEIQNTFLRERERIQNGRKEFEGIGTRCNAGIINNTYRGHSERRFISTSGISKSSIEENSVFKIPFATDPRNNLHSMLRCDVVSSEKQDSNMLLQQNAQQLVFKRDSREDSRLRWAHATFIAERAKITAQRTASDLYRRLKAHQDEIFAVSHLEYINREAAFKNRGDCVYQGNHLPKWANGDPKTFFKMADKYEAKNNSKYREIEFSLPNELTQKQNLEIINEFLKKHLSNHYYAFAIHDKIGSLSQEERHPHVHIMFSERMIDEAEKEEERSADKFFRYPKRGAKTNEEKRQGGAPKDRTWSDLIKSKKKLMEMREDCAILQNKYLAKHGFMETVDHRSLKDMQKEAIENGDNILAEVLNRIPEQYIGLTNKMKENCLLIKHLREKRYIKNEKLKLLYEKDYLENILSSRAFEEKYEGKEDEINNFISDIQTLTTENDKLINLKNEFDEKVILINALKKTVLGTDEAKKEAILGCLPYDEKEEWLKYYELLIEKNSLAQFYNDTQKDYYECKEQDKKAKLKQTADELLPRIYSLNDRIKLKEDNIAHILKKLNTDAYKKKIQTYTHQILYDNKSVKDKINFEVAKLDKLMDKIQAEIKHEAEEKAKPKVEYNTYSLAEICQELLEEKNRINIKLQDITAEMNEVYKNTISEPRAESIATSLYLNKVTKGEYKELKEKYDKVKNIDNSIEAMRNKLHIEKRLNEIKELLTSPEAKTKISEIKQGILNKHALENNKYQKLVSKKNTLYENLKNISADIKTVYKEMYFRKKNISYSIPKGSNRTDRNKTNDISLIAKFIASENKNEPTLPIIRIGEAQEMEKDWNLLSEIEKDELKIKQYSR